MSATWTHPSRLDTFFIPTLLLLLYKVEIQSYFDWIFKGFEEMIKIDDVGICFILYLRHQLGSH